MAAPSPRLRGERLPQQSLLQPLLRTVGSSPGSSGTSAEDTSQGFAILELLAEQQAAVQRALDCNQRLAQRFAHQAGLGEDAAARPSAAAWNGGARTDAAAGGHGNPRRGAGADDLKPSNKPLGAWGAVLADAMDASAPSARRPAPSAPAWTPSSSAPPSSRQAAGQPPWTPGRPRVGSGICDAKDKPTPLFYQGPSKKNVLDAITEPEFDAEQDFMDAGPWQALARSDAFQTTSMAMIVVNILWLGIDTDYNKAAILCDAPVLFQVVDNVFCSFFVFELMVRLWAYKSIWIGLRHGWVAFDMALVMTMVWETWVAVAIYLIVGDQVGQGTSKMTIFRAFRLVRLLRVARMVRLIHSVPELMILVKALSMAVRSVFATLLLLVVTIYTFSILLTMLISGSESAAGYFDTVPQSMNTLLLQGVFGGNNDVFDRMLGESFFYYMVFLLYMVFGSLTVLNMLIGIICEVVSTVADGEKVEVAAHELRHVIAHIVKHVDSDCSDSISRAEFVSMLDDGDAMRALHQVGVDVVALVDFVDFIFRGEEELEISDFAETVVQFRGENTATVKDIVDLRMFFSAELARLGSRLTSPAQ